MDRALKGLVSHLDPRPGRETSTLSPCCITIREHCLQCSKFKWVALRVKCHVSRHVDGGEEEAGDGGGERKKERNRGSTAPSIPSRLPVQVLTWPDVA